MCTAKIQAAKYVSINWQENLSGTMAKGMPLRLLT
ncbi:unknown [Prevotella sp. CAG:1031]|nr:unknown [Prevotella sp. CAG:1031]